MREKQTPGSARPELAEVHPPGRRELSGEMSGDQEAGDHEEDVDADVAAAQAPRPEVVKHHEENGDGSQALHVRDEAAGCGVLR